MPSGTICLHVYSVLFSKYHTHSTLVPQELVSFETGAHASYTAVLLLLRACALDLIRKSDSLLLGEIASMFQRYEFDTSVEWVADSEVNSHVKQRPYVRSLIISNLLYLDFLVFAQHILMPTPILFLRTNKNNITKNDSILSIVL